MIHLIQQLMKRGKGLAIVGGVVEGKFEEKHEFVEASMLKMREALIERGIEGFPEVICAPTIYEGYKTLVTAKGLGSLRPNTVMLGFPNDVNSMRSVFTTPLFNLSLSFCLPASLIKPTLKTAKMKLITMHSCAVSWLSLKRLYSFAREVNSSQLLPVAMKGAGRMQECMRRCLAILMFGGSSIYFHPMDSCFCCLIYSNSTKCGKSKEPSFEIHVHHLFK